MIFVTILVGIASAAFVGSLAQLLRRDRQTHGAVFRSMCTGLGLSPSQRRLLRRLARHGGVRYPASLLVSRGCYEHAVKRCGPRLPAKDLGVVRDTVFD